MGDDGHDAAPGEYPAGEGRPAPGRADDPWQAAAETALVAGERPDELIGRTLGHCVIVGLLGQGGMARVYRARQEHLERDVAIKVLPPYYASDSDFVERFKLEARAMARLSHPNIVTIHDAGEDDGRLFITMEYLSGGTLKDRMDRYLAPREVVRVFREVASALAYAHEQGIIHRDVKPVNVLLDGAGRAVLSDFGIAKVLATSRALTRPRAGVGTPEYMSPEQCRGIHIDSRADIYALGVLLYEMLTLRTPFVAEDYAALAHSHIYEPVPPPSRLNPRISPAVQSVVLKALEKDPSLRFQSATEMADALTMAMEAQLPLVSPHHEPRATGAPRHAPASPPAHGPASGVIYCPRCHAQNPAHQRFCSSCGQQLGASPAGTPSYPSASPGSNAVACPRCAAANPGSNRFCTRCGSPLYAGPRSTGMPPHSPISAPHASAPCPACGTRNAPGTRFCTRCGRSLA